MLFIRSQTDILWLLVIHICSMNSKEEQRIMIKKTDLNIDNLSYLFDLLFPDYLLFLKLKCQILQLKIKDLAIFKKLELL